MPVLPIRNGDRAVLGLAASALEDAMVQMLTTPCAPAATDATGRYEVLEGNACGCTKTPKRGGSALTLKHDENAREVSGTLRERPDKKVSQARPTLCRNKRTERDESRRRAQQRAISYGDIATTAASKVHAARQRVTLTSTTQPCGHRLSGDLTGPPKRLMPTRYVRQSGVKRATTNPSNTIAAHGL